VAVVAAGEAGPFRGNFKSSFVHGQRDRPEHRRPRPLSSARLKSGRTFASSDAAAKVAVVNADYATQKKLSIGSTVTVAKTSFKWWHRQRGQQRLRRVHPAGPGAALASLKGKVNTIYVAADSASNISGVAKEISGMLPKPR